MEIQVTLWGIASGTIIKEAIIPQGKDSTAKFLGKVIKESENVTLWFEENSKYIRPVTTEVQLEGKNIKGETVVCEKVGQVKSGVPIWAYFLKFLKGKTILRELIVNHPLDGTVIILCVTMLNKNSRETVMFEMFFQVLIQGKPVTKEDDKKEQSQEAPQESTSQVRILHGDTKPITTQELECPYCHNCMKITVNDIVIPAQHQKQIIVSETTQKIPFEKAKEKTPKEVVDLTKDHICRKCAKEYPACGQMPDVKDGQQSCEEFEAKKPEKVSKKKSKKEGK